MKDKKRILIVEDEVPLLEAIKKKLENSGFNTLEARTTEEALEHIEGDKKIDVVWLDHYLIGQNDGTQLVKKLKSGDSEFRNIPVFLVTNTAGPEKLQTYVRLGVDKYYIKADHRLDEIVKDVKEFIIDKGLTN